MMKSTSLNSLLEPGSRNAFLSEKPYYTIFAFYIQDAQQSFSILRTLEAATCIYNAPNASTLDWMHYSHGRIKGLSFEAIALFWAFQLFSASWRPSASFSTILKYDPWINQLTSFKCIYITTELGKNIPARFQEWLAEMLRHKCLFGVGSGTLWGWFLELSRIVFSHSIIGFVFGIGSAVCLTSVTNAAIMPNCGVPHAATVSVLHVIFPS